jgi:multiple sugar transport system permease protein
MTEQSTTTVPGGAGVRRPRGRDQLRATLGGRNLPYWLVLPAILYLALFFAWPMVQAFGLAFVGEDGGLTLDHVRTMVDDVAFPGALRFTLLLLVIIIPIEFAVALTMALMVNSPRLRGRGLFLYIYAIPLAVSELAAGIVWFAIFTQQGYLNSALQQLGLADVPFIWLDPRSTEQLLLAVVLAEVWRSTSLIMIILVAGLQGIPRDFLEAAELFGAGPLTRVRKVILPMLKPSIQVALIFRTILAFQVFATVIALTGRGATVLTAEAYRWQTDIRDANVAAAYAGLILALSIVSTMVILRLTRTPREQRMI